MNGAQRVAGRKAAADLFTRLLTVDCRAETVAAIKNEGELAIAQSFSVLGQVAMQSLVRDPDVKASIGQIEQDIDVNKFKALEK